MKVLVVDDETDVRLLFLQKFRKELKAGEIELEFAFSGEEAIDYVTSHEKELLYILSDINMPGMSGLEMLRTIREIYRNPPPTIMMITAYDDSENRSLAASLGAEDFLTKPLDFNELKGKLLDKAS